MTPARRSLRDYVVVQGSYAFILALPLAAVFSHRAFAPIAALMALVAATRVASWMRLRDIFFPPIRLRAAQTALTFALAAFALWVAITGFWSPTPGAVWKAISVGVAALATYLLGAEILARNSAESQTLATSFGASVVVALAILFFEAHTNGYLRLITPPADASPDRFKDITALGRGLAAVMPGAFAGVVMLLLAARLRPAPSAALASAVFAIALSAALELTIAANSAAVLAGTGAALVASKAPRGAIAALTAAFLAALLLAPAIAFLPVDVIAERLAGTLPLSWAQRLYVWRHAAVEALPCLPVGCGADYARSLAAARETFLAPGSPEPLLLVPLHPHNLFLQIWLELGLPGVALAGIAMIAGGKLALDAALSRPVAAALAGLLAATFIYWSVEASLWQEWRLASIVIAASAVAICSNLSRARA